MPKRRANGEGSIYRRKDGTWTAQYTDFTGRKRYLYGKTQQIVKDKLKEAIRQNDGGFVLDTKRTTFSGWIAEWLDIYVKPNVKPRTYHIYHVYIYLHIIPAFPKVLLRDIREDMIQRFSSEMQETRKDGKPGGYSKSTVKHAITLIYSALEKAVDLGMIPRNPAKKLPPIKKEVKEMQILTKSQQKALEAVIESTLEREYNNAIFLLILYTGLRIGEAIGLKTSDLDLESGLLHVRRTVGRITRPGSDACEIEAGDPKTRTSRRTIPIPSRIVGLLKMVIEKRAERIERLIPMWETSPKWTPKWKEDDYLFLTFYGNVFDAQSIRRILVRLEKEAGIDTFVPLHGLRHTFATRWIEAGLDVKSLSEILGHADASITLNVYAHSLEEQKRAGLEKLSGVLELL